MYLQFINNLSMVFLSIALASISFLILKDMKNKIMFALSELYTTLSKLIFRIKNRAKGGLDETQN